MRHNNNKATTSSSSAAALSNSTGKRPLLARRRIPDDQMTTSSQLTKQSKSSVSENQPTRGKRRLRLFGGLGVHSSSATAQYNFATPSSQPSRSSGSSSKQSQPLSPASDASSHQHYDTRPIYPEAMPSSTATESSVHSSSVSSGSMPQHSHQHEHHHHHHQGTTKTSKTTTIPVLPSNAKDSKRKVRPKADPPTRQEQEEALQQAAQEKEEEEEAAHDTTNHQQIFRRSTGPPTGPPPPLYMDSMTTLSSTTSTAALNSLPRLKQPMMVIKEEKKMDDHDHSITNHAADDPVRTLLSRPYGRQSLPTRVGRNFVVQVSSAEWDADEERWKYRILVQQRPSKSSAAAANDATTTSGPGSFTTAYCWRSLNDFSWLEQALRHEFHGALLVPLLNLAVGVAAVSDATAVPVEAELLRHWLTDLLNGIRGAGEWLYLESAAPHRPVSIWQSEALETFLYRTGALTASQLQAWAVTTDQDETNATLVQRLAKTVEALGTEWCVGPLPVDDSSVGRFTQWRKPSPGMCTSNALESTFSLDRNDSVVDKSYFHHDHPVFLMHYLLRNYRETALSVMEKLSHLRSAEEALGVAWKRLAIALTNLFAYEKDVETAKLGDMKVKRENMPFRKVPKSHVDDGLRVLSRCKTERNGAALSHVRDFVSALLADLSAVAPAVQVFEQAQARWQQNNASSAPSSRKTPEWLPRARSLLSIQNPSDDQESQNLLQRQKTERNQEALQQALVSMIRHLPVRMARIAWRYWQTEIKQAAELGKAAATVRTNVNIVKEESISRMLKRHLEEETQDKEVEMALIVRMLQIGHKSDEDALEKRNFALNLAKERLGRWDIKLGMAMMDAIGIEDPNIRVEETTRDLRLVRKYAIGLRECLNRCVEAVGGVRAALQASEGPCRDLREARKQFFSVLAQLFSGKIVREDLKQAPWNTLPATLQEKVGVTPTTDPFQWSAVFAPEQQARRNHLSQNSVGQLARDCLETKDSNTAWLLSCMSELLNDYQDRVQQVESYVYMECVGIQLERHFSEKRAAALAVFEKKTDITTAMNVARKKKLPKLVDELQRKLDEIGNEVSQTTVREAKELHLESKQLKSDIHDLAVRCLVRARETSTERAVALMSLWAKEEENSAATELKAIGEAIAALEKRTGEEDLETSFQGGVEL